MAECTGVGPHINPPAPKPKGGCCVTIADIVYDEEISNSKLTLTAGEIISAAETGIVMAKELYEEEGLTEMSFYYLGRHEISDGEGGTKYTFTFFNSGGGTGFEASSEDEYPTLDLG